MVAELGKKLEETFKDIEERYQNNYLIDWDDLAEIYHVVTYCSNSEALKNTWLAKLSNQDFSSNVIEAATKQSIEKYDRIQRIVSIGDYWNDDEWVLVLLLRLELEMLKDFFNYKKINFPPLNLASLCEKMQDLAQTTKNKEVFEFSVRQMKKNSPLPFADIWFQADEPTSG